MKLLDQVGVRGRTIFIRCEFNVSLDEDAAVMDYTRLRASLPTLQRLSSQGARTVICSHIGRPWGKRDPSKSLSQIVAPLSDLLGSEIGFVDDCIGPNRKAKQQSLKDGQFLLLENVRYHLAENENSREFANALVSGIDVYVNDAFGNCHRSHASMVAAAELSPEKCAGYLLERELKELSLVEDASLHPSVAIIGGAKVSGKDGKIRVIDRLVAKVDIVTVVGKIAYCFLMAKGYAVGRTVSADARGIDAPGANIAEDVAACERVLSRASKVGCEIILPLDSSVSVADTVVECVHGLDGFPPEGRALDIGPKTLEKMKDVLSAAKLVVWNGPAGFFEMPEFRHGTLEIARIVKQSNAHAIIGGGDTVTAISEIATEERGHLHICTGGGAMLTLLAGETLPAVKALD